MIYSCFEFFENIIKHEIYLTDQKSLGEDMEEEFSLESKNASLGNLLQLLFKISQYTPKD